MQTSKLLEYGLKSERGTHFIYYNYMATENATESDQSSTLDFIISLRGLTIMYD